MLERVKSILLIFLICTSIYLTWRILDYQAQYDYLLPAEYVTQVGLAEKKELGELLKPLMLVYHYGEEIHRVTYPDMFQYMVIQEQMKDWYFYNFKKMNAEQLATWQEARQANEGIEFIFPTGLPFSMLGELFHIPNHDQPLPLTNRLWLFHDQETDEINAYFFSEAEQSMTKARTSLSLGELRTYLALGENRPLYQAFAFQPTEANELTRVHYLPTEALEMIEYQYFYKRIPISSVIPYLFVDPSLVRKIEERERSSFYTDGSRGLQLDNEELSMYYFHPLLDPSPSPRTEHDNYVQRSIQFVNQHQGWEHSYHLFALEQSEPEQKRHIQFRKFVRNFPLFSERVEEEYNVLQVDMQGERVIGYYRPLFYIDQLMNQFTRELPSGLELVQELERQEFPLEKISSMYVGYQSIIGQYHLRYIPCWVIELEDGERHFLRNLGEEISYELE